MMRHFWWRLMYPDFHALESELKIARAELDVERARTAVWRESNARNITDLDEHRAVMRELWEFIGPVDRRSLTVDLGQRCAALGIDRRPQRPMMRQLEANREFPDDDDGHDSYVQPLDGGYKGYQAKCWDCDWAGPEHLRAEDLNAPEGQAHKRNARNEAHQHRQDTKP